MKLMYLNGSSFGVQTQRLQHLGGVNGSQWRLSGAVYLRVICLPPFYAMPDTTEMDYPKPQEKEMSARLRSLVDNCFQEGQYEAGFVELNRLRSSTNKPSV